MLLKNEKLLTMAEARKVVASRTGRRMDISSLWRWARRGVRGVKLEHICVGRELRTSAQALDRFYRRLADAYVVDERSPATSITSLSHLAADAELEAAGL